MSDTPATPTTPAQSASEAPDSTGVAVEGRDTQPAPAPKKKAPTYRSYKVGDETVNLTDEDIARDYGKWKGADSKFREAAQTKQSVEQFMRALQEDPELVLSDKRLPFDKRKLAEKWLLEEIESQLTPADPRDQRLSEQERRIQEYEDREADEAQTKEEAARTEAVQARREALSSTLAQAMELSPLSAHPESKAATLREMAMYMRAAKERGEDVTPQQLMDHIHNNRYHQMYTLANEFEGEDLIEFLGEEVVKRIRKADLSRLKASREGSQSHKSESWAPTRNRPTGRMDAHQAKEHARKLLGGGR